MKTTFILPMVIYFKLTSVFIFPENIYGSILHHHKALFTQEWQLKVSISCTFISKPYSLVENTSDKFVIPIS